MPTTGKSQSILPAASKITRIEVKNCKSYANTKRENRYLGKYWNSIIPTEFCNTGTEKKMVVAKPLSVTINLSNSAGIWLCPGEVAT